jgi:hypothetical protein
MLPAAAPPIPRAGKGPGPKMSSALMVMSRVTTMAVLRSGVRESPTPRSVLARVKLRAVHAEPMSRTRRYSVPACAAPPSAPSARSTQGASAAPASPSTVDWSSASSSDCRRMCDAAAASPAPRARATSAMVPVVIPNTRIITIIAIGLAIPSPATASGPRRDSMYTLAKPATQVSRLLPAMGAASAATSRISACSERFCDAAGRLGTVASAGEGTFCPVPSAADGVSKTHGALGRPSIFCRQR